MDSPTGAVLLVDTDAVLSSVALARPTLARMSLTLATQVNTRGRLLWWAIYCSIAAINSRHGERPRAAGVGSSDHETTVQ